MIDDDLVEYAREETDIGNYVEGSPEYQEYLREIREDLVNEGVEEDLKDMCAKLTSKYPLTITCSFDNIYSWRILIDAIPSLAALKRFILEGENSNNNIHQEIYYWLLNDLTEGNLENSKYRGIEIRGSGGHVVHL